MRASELTFQNVLDAALRCREYAETRSFMQVEYGIKELEAAWDAYRDSSDYCNEEFQDANHVYSEFYHLVAEYAEEYESLPR